MTKKGIDPKAELERHFSARASARMAKLGSIPVGGRIVR